MVDLSILEPKPNVYNVVIFSIGRAWIEYNPLENSFRNASLSSVLISY